MEINHLWPELTVFQQACPMWVPLVENGELNGIGAEYFVQKNLNDLLLQSDKIDTVLLACTHYPMLLPVIRSFIPPKIKIVEQGGIAAKSLKDYLQRHPEMDELSGQNGKLLFQTTGDTSDFNEKATLFFDKTIRSEHVKI